MAGFFSLSSNPRNSDNDNNNHIIPSQDSWYLYRSSHEEEIPTCNNKGFELDTHELYHSSSAVGSDAVMMNMMMGGPTAGGAGEGVSCQDCGNQAKKDCLYMRCRTCCKSQGFDCPTHVKSTWVPASVRRGRHQQPPPPQNDGEDLDAQLKRVRRGRKGSSYSSSLVCTQMPVTTARSLSGMEVGNFPPEVSSPAVFRCVRVSSMDNSEEEYAYQTAVNIGGHVFKGILYDQGLEHQPQGATSSSYVGGAGDSSSGFHDVGPNSASGSASGSAPASVAAWPSPPVAGFVDPSMYPVPLSSYMPPGTQFFSNSKSLE